MIPQTSYGQSLSNYRIKNIFIDKDTIEVDSLSIISDSWKIEWNKTTFNPSDISVDFLKGKLIRLNSTKRDSIKVSYRVYPINFGKTYYKKSTSLILPKGVISSNTLPTFKSAEGREESLLGFSNLEKSGSLSRGITIGNNQDLSVNSNLNLQLAGTLKNDIQVLASITDQNIPIQPDGNTQQIQDFDQVYIQLFNSKFKLLAGDLTLKPNDSYFLRYLKKGQGIGYTSFFKNTDEIRKTDSLSEKLEVHVAAAASRGKFSRNTLPVIEGNQGPYALVGKDNELFIIVISGTERVFLDGRLLVRGMDNDYVIDYNAAEITFTPKQLVTNNSRIVIEFQYTDKNYARYLLQTNNTYQSKKLKLHFNAFSEQDLKNQPLQQELTDSNRYFLKNLGDNLQEAIVKRIDSIGFNSDYPMYKLIDSLGYDSVFVHSNNKDSAVYRLSFSDVGRGNGNYNTNGFSTAGRLFKWVAPNPDGTLNGRFAPVILLVTPKKNQIITGGGTYQLGNKTKVIFEGGYSNTDLNTFSKLDRADNQGYSSKIELEQTIPIGGINSGWSINLNGNSEHTSKYFSPIERFREVEFSRNWNTPTLLTTDYQWINGARIKINKTGVGQTDYELSSFIHGEQFQGIRNKFGSNLTYGGGRIEFIGSLVKTKGNGFSSDFLRHKSHLSKNLKYFAIHYRDEHEKNLFKDSTLNLSANGYRFYNWEVSIENIDSFNQQYRLFYGERLDRRVLNQSLSKTNFARNYGLESSLINKANHKLKGRAIQRDFIILNEQLTELKPENTLAGRVEYLFRLKNGSISTHTFYEIGSGLERKKEYLFKKVTAGQGVYIWIDRDEDEIEDLDEFEVAIPPNRGDYIRVYIPTNEFLKAYTNRFTETFNLQAPKNWRKVERIDSTKVSKRKNFTQSVKKFASLFTDQVSFQIGRKSTEKNGFDAFNPFLFKTSDTTLVSLNKSIRNNLYFNRLNPVYNFFHTYNENESKTLLTTGFESRKNKFNELNGRWNVHRNFSLNGAGKIGEKANLSFLKSRNFSINYRGINSSISYLPNNFLKLSLMAEYEEKRNDRKFGNETSFTRDFGIEFRYNSIEKGNITLQFNFVDISFNGENNTALSYEMLEALQTGNNYTWNLHFQRNLGNNLQLDIQYQGRKSNNVKIIHIGSMSLRALF